MSCLKAAYVLSIFLLFIVFDGGWSNGCVSVDSGLCLSASSGVLKFESQEILMESQWQGVLDSVATAAGVTK